MPYRTVRPGVIQIGGNFVGGLSTEPLYEYQPLPDSELIKELPERTWWQRWLSGNSNEEELSRQRRAEGIKKSMLVRSGQAQFDNPSWNNPLKPEDIAYGKKLTPEIIMRGIAQGLLFAPNSHNGDATYMVHRAVQDPSGRPVPSPSALGSIDIKGEYNPFLYSKTGWSYIGDFLENLPEKVSNLPTGVKVAALPFLSPSLIPTLGTLAGQALIPGSIPTGLYSQEEFAQYINYSEDERTLPLPVKRGEGRVLMSTRR